MKIVRTKEEILAKIKELSLDTSNFGDDNYGSEAADNGEYEEHISSSAAEWTMKKLYEWMINKDYSL
jgi:hypothetical protein